MSVRRASMLLALMSIAAILLFPSIALAEDPPSAPMTIVSEGFEGPTASYNVQSPVKRWWGPVSVRKQSGARGMWCNGSVGVSPSPFQYVSGSSGDVQFALPQTADLYSSTARFGYTMPSLGQADAGSFNMQWYRADDPLHPVRSNYSLTGVNTWSQVNSDLTWGTGGAHTVVSLSRAAGVLAFVWNDQLEGYGQPISVGEGPTIDDVLVTGYRYGPVQALTVTPREAGGLTLAWNRPAKLAGTTTPQEDRAINYRVWRMALGESSWTEVTAPTVNDDGGLPAHAELVDETALAGVSYRYRVVAFDPSGTGYGETAESVVSGPTVAIQQPTTDFAITNDVLVVSSASDSAGVSGAEVQIRRRDIGYWNGSSWQADEKWLPMSSGDGYATSQYHWLPDPAPQSWGALQAEIRVRATDGLGYVAESPEIIRSKRIVTTLSPSSGVTSVIGYGSSYALTGYLKTSTGATALPGKTVALQQLSGGVYKTVKTVSTWSTGKAPFTVAPTAKTTYRLLFSGDETYLGRSTSTVTITPRVSLGTPSRPSSATRNKAFTSTGTLKPRHSVGSKPVIIYKYRYSGGKWVSSGYVYAKASNYSSYSRYSASVTITTAGTWRLRAKAPADSSHAETWSSYSSSFSVK